MSDEQDRSSKTEEPTERKLEKAREKGQVPRSREINNFIMLIGIAFALMLTMPPMFESIMNFTGGMFAEAGKVELESRGVMQIAELMTKTFLLALLPTMMLFVALGLFGGFIQTGILFAVEPIKPKMSKISLIKGVGRMFSKKAVMEFIKSLMKMSMIGAIMYVVIFLHREDLAVVNNMSVMATVVLVQEIMLQAILGVLAISALLAIMDYLFQRHDFREDQRMTKQELKDEFKDTQGDPFVKNRQRQIRMERARQRMMQDIPESQVVITNPTHYALALRYDTEKDAAPRVVAKGADHIAMKIREIAQEHDIPLVEDPPLARALFNRTEVDEEVPLELYEAVAKVISYVYALKNKTPGTKYEPSKIPEELQEAS